MSHMKLEAEHELYLPTEWHANFFFFFLSFLRIYPAWFTEGVWCFQRSQTHGLYTEG